MQNIILKTENFLAREGAGGEYYVVIEREIADKSDH